METQFKQDSLSHDVLREFFKRWPKLYYWMSRLFGPIWFTGMEPSDFLRKHARTGKIVNIGSGPRRIRKDIVNVDMTPYEAVDVVGDATHLPFDSGTVYMIICDNVLEHVVDPSTAVREVERVLAPGGVAYFSTPYLYPFHGSPSDYYRWTHEGLKVLLKDYKLLEIGVRGGAMSSLTIQLANIAGRITCLGSERAYWMLSNAFLVLFSPLKLFDVVLNFFPFGSHTASVFYCVVEKKS
jgi:SAM-dependent methyltransferase